MELAQIIGLRRNQSGGDANNEAKNKGAAIIDPTPSGYDGISWRQFGIGRLPSAATGFLLHHLLTFDPADILGILHHQLTTRVVNHGIRLGSVPAGNVAFRIFKQVDGGQDDLKSTPCM